MGTSDSRKLEGLTQKNTKVRLENIGSSDPKKGRNDQKKTVSTDSEKWRVDSKKWDALTQKNWKVWLEKSEGLNQKSGKDQADKWERLTWKMRRYDSKHGRSVLKQGRHIDTSQLSQCLQRCDLRIFQEI